MRDQGKYLSPNGGHRLTALQELGAKSVLALVVPERRVAYQILALNIEKAHNLREKSLEVVRMYRDLARVDEASGRGEARLPSRESDLSLELEEPAFATLGFAYEKRGRFSGGAYQSILKRVDAFLDQPLASAMAERERRADVLLTFDDAVIAAVAKLKERGFESPYLKAFVVARVNPLRFVKSAAPPFDELFAQMTKRALALDPGKIRSADVARSGGAPETDS